MRRVENYFVRLKAVGVGEVEPQPVKAMSLVARELQLAEEVEEELPERPLDARQMHSAQLVLLENVLCGRSVEAEAEGPREARL